MTKLNRIANRNYKIHHQSGSYYQVSQKLIDEVDRK